MGAKITSQRTRSKLSDAKKADVLRQLQEVVGREWVSDDPVFGASWGRDAECRVDEPTYYPDFVALPVSTEEVAQVVRIANREALEIEVGCGGASTFGSLMMHNGGIFIDVRRMSKIIEIDEDTMTVTLETGVTFGVLRAEAGKVGLRCDVPGAPTCSGVLPNLCVHGGEHVHGTRNNLGITKLLAIELVTPTGDIVRTGSLAFPRSKPGLCGPDWDFSTLPVASSGLAGIVTRGVVKLFPLGDARKRKKRLEIAFFKDFGAACSALADIGVQDLAISAAECGPKYFGGTLPTGTLEDHVKVVSLLAPQWAAMVWADMWGTEEQVAYQTRAVRQIWEKHGADTALAAGMDLMCNEPTKPKEACQLVKGLLGVDIVADWVPRIAKMFDVVEVGPRGFGVAGQVLVGTYSAGTDTAKASCEAFHKVMKREQYPGYDEGQWATYGTIFRGSTGKLQELDVHYDRADKKSCDDRDRFLAAFAKHCREHKVTTFYQPAAFGYLANPPHAMLGAGGDYWLKIRRLLDPNRTMHRHRAFDKAGTDI